MADTPETKGMVVTARGEVITAHSNDDDEYYVIGITSQCNGSSIRLSQQEILRVVDMLMAVSR